MTIPPHILETAYGKEGAEREDYLFEVLETIFGTITSITETLPPEARDMPLQRQHILSMLLLNAGKVVNSRAISEYLGAVYDKEAGPQIGTIKVQICRLKKSIPASFGEVETVWGQGYRLNLAEGA